MSDFFLVDEADGVLTSSFRGRQVMGVRLSVPEGFVGTMATVDEGRNQKKRKVDISDEEDDNEDDVAYQLEQQQHTDARKGVVKSTWKELVLWDHDAPPLDSDNPFEWMKWPKFAASIHKPVSKDDMLARDEKFAAAKE